MKVWQGLGYYTRARNMHEAAKTIQECFNGRLPDNYNDLLNIPGIGPYTAAAIASFAYKEAVPVLDGNVIRVIARLFGYYYDPVKARGKKIFHKKAAEIIDRDRPGIFNQAIMEFGAMHCMPREPRCESCPLQSVCYAYRHDVVDVLPVKKEKKTGRKRYFHYLVVINDTAVLLGKREQNDIWQSLYEFPLIETTRPVGPERISALPVFQQVLGHESFKIVKYSRVYKHILSHQQIFARFYLICINGDAIMDSDGFFPVAFDEIQDYPVPRLLDKFLMGGYWSDWKSSYC